MRGNGMMDDGMRMAMAVTIDDRLGKMRDDGHEG